MSAANTPQLDLPALIRCATQTIESARYCWIAIADGSGGVRARPMGRLPCELDADRWMLRFLSDARSRKVADIRRSRCATVALQDGENAFVSVTGAATLNDDAVELSPHWRGAYDAFFPSPRDRAHATFIEVNVSRVELWVREHGGAQFGLWPALFVRDAAGRWESIPYERG